MDLLSTLQLILAAAFLVVWIRRFLGKKSRLSQLAEKLPGPQTLPLLGNVLDVGLDRIVLYDVLTNLLEKHGPVLRLWLGSTLLVFICDPDDVEILLSSSKHITKADMPYNFLHPWLGKGLLTETGEMWHRARKMLTPAFHFKILENFIDVFNQNTTILVSKLKEKVNKGELDIHQYVTLCSLDIICESSMGTQINAQVKLENEYASAIRNQSDLIVDRVVRPWLYPDFLFNLSTLGRIQKKALEVLHGTSNSVIRNRRKEFTSKAPVSAQNEDDFGQKKRLALLDLLLEYSQSERGLTQEQIREQVDTFMFEGHDTTSSGLAFTLWSLSIYPDIQEKVFQEVEQLLPNPDDHVTFQSLQEMKYLEKVIKEALRLYPTVPIFGRKLVEDLALAKGELLVPEGTFIFVFAAKLQKDPKHFPNPEVFDPERFSQENSKGRHPYAYVPFSAGPRNCIGQKFAMLEMKSIISRVVRNFKLLPSSNGKNVTLEIDLILKTPHGLNLKLQPRS